MMVNVPRALISGRTPIERDTFRARGMCLRRGSGCGRHRGRGQGSSHAKQAALLQQIAAIESAFPPRRFSGEQTEEHNVFSTG